MTIEIHRYPVGAIEVTVLSDGFRRTPLENFIRNATVEEIAAALEAAGLPSDHIRNSYAPIVVSTGGRRLLFDTGNGEAVLGESKGERGTLNSHLDAAGFGRAGIDTVVITHFHGDHVNGLLLADGSPAFPQAEILVPEVEWNFWMDDAEMARAPKGRMADLFANNRRVFDAIGRKVRAYKWDTEIAPGVLALGTPGHTPGHTAYMISSGGKRVFVQSDVTNNSALFVPNPHWHAFFDQDAEAAEATRRRVYDMVAAEKIPVQAFHHRFPALSRIEKTGSGYRAIPINGV